jgi:hypothetical protein
LRWYAGTFEVIIFAGALQICSADADYLPMRNPKMKLVPKWGTLCFITITTASQVAGNSMGTNGASPSMPFTFVENQGQADRKVRFIGNGPDFKAWFRNDGVTLQHGSAVTQVHFENGAGTPGIEAAEPLGATANYIHGNNPAQWQTALPLFSMVHYQGVWPGIEIRFKAEHSRAKAEYVVAPGATADQIRLRFDGVPAIQSNGSLTVVNESGQFQEDRPILFQQAGGRTIPVQGAFRINQDGTVGFTVGAYDPLKSLIIDPTILFSGHYGGYSQSTITALAVNSAYTVIAAGWTIGTDLGSAGAAYRNNSGGVDAFVAAFSPAGGALLYCTYLGGSGDDRAFGVAVDAANNTYVTGWTSSLNFPVVAPYQAKLKGTRDAFVAKLNASGTALIYSTYLGGTGSDQGNAITLDSTGAAFVVGDTNSVNLTVTAGVFQPRSGGGQDAFVAKISPAGSSLGFLTYFGGSGTEHATAIRRDTSGALFFGGSTWSGDLPTLNPWQSKSGGGQDAFLTKMSADGKTILYSTYFGGSGGSPGEPEQINSIAIQTGGAVLVGGVTSSRDLPIKASAVQTSYGGGLTDGFFARFQNAGGTLLASSYFGGSLDDCVNAIEVDYLAYIHIAGYTSSPDLPTRNPLQNSIGGAIDAFAAKVKFDRIVYSTYLGGSGNDSANAIVIDSLTSVIVAGTTGSANFPVVGSLNATAGSLSAFVTKLIPGFNLAVTSAPSFLFDVWHVTGYGGILNGSTFGATADIPVSGDWTGTGVKRIGVFRDGAWILDTNGNGVIDNGDRTIQFGQAGDRPVVGDWNGTGRIKLGLFRQGTFILDLSGHLSGITTGLNDVSFSFGQSGDLPVAADWNQSGTTKVGVFRNGQWLVDYSGTQTPTVTYAYGQAGDIPVIGDWDGAGTAKIGVYRSGLWILNYAGSNSVMWRGDYELYLLFGGAGYLPLVY